MAKETLIGVARGAVLSPGSIASGRFQIEGLDQLFGSIVLYNAKDQRTQRAVALWAVPPRLIKLDALTATRAAVKTASAIAHKNLVVPFGSSSDPMGTLFVATEPLGAPSVADLIEKKRAEGQVHGLPAAYQLLAPAMNGLTVVHASLAHGALCPAMLRIDAEGTVKVAGLGIAAALVAAGVAKPEYLAPEVREGGAATVRADIYSLGAILYELCSGQKPDPAVPVSSVTPGLPGTFDIIIENCLAQNPEDRFETVLEMKGALASLVSPTLHPPPDSDGFDVPIEFDDAIDPGAAVAAAPPTRLSNRAPAGSAQSVAFPPQTATGFAPAPAALPHMQSQPGAPQVGARMSMPDVQRPSATTLPDAGQMNQVDLKGLLDQATADDAQRWMFVRGGLDHGPLSARELIQAIVRNEVLDDDVVFNMDSGERRKLTEWAQYREFAEQAREKRKRDRHAREVKGAIAEDSVNTKAKSAVAVALVIVVGLLAVVYFKTLSPAARMASRQRELDDLVSRGQLRLAEGTLEVLPAPAAPPPGSSRGRSSGGGGGGGGGYAGSYESAMNQPVDYNFGGGGPGGGTLSDREISGPLNGVLGRFGSCATAEIARGGNAREVRMRIAVGGTGAPIGVTVLNGSGAFKSCVSGVVRGLRWRAFGGPRVGFAWGFSLQ